MNEQRPEKGIPGSRAQGLLNGLRYVLAALAIAAFSSVLALEGSEEQTILEGLQASSDQFSTFLGMLEETGLTETLQQPGPMTVLAPPDAAFDDLDDGVAAELRSSPEQLTSFINGLIISGQHLMVDLEEAGDTGALAPLSEESYQIEMTAGGLTVNGVDFDPTDVDNVYSNGVVHVTNAVVLPQSLRGMADAEAEGAADDANDADDADAATEQDAATEPADPDVAAPGAPGATGATDQPVTEAEEPDEAYVRVVQLVPATNIDIALTPTEEGLASVEFSGLEYVGEAQYQAVQPGSYLVNTTMAGSDDLLFDPPTESFGAGEYYTIAVMGLVVPEEGAAQDGADGEQNGFAGWLNDLFGADDGDGDALSVRVATYQDEVRDEATESRVRVINAAPGSPAFDVVAEDATGDRHVIAGNMTFGDDSGANDLPAELSRLAVTAADSEAVALNLTEELPLPIDATVFLTGTSFEGVPFDALVLSNGGGAGATNDAQ